mmetsp:Transcript_33449/g.86953  ORF Transcript_33449/g.86953 Transcript_33449/m.86953 type:complete len:219 (-) Transcript_33449:147-803(-)
MQGGRGKIVRVLQQAKVLARPIQDPGNGLRELRALQLPQPPALLLRQNATVQRIVLSSGSSAGSAGILAGRPPIHRRAAVSAVLRTCRTGLGLPRIPQDAVRGPPFVAPVLGTELLPPGDRLQQPNPRPPRRVALQHGHDVPTAQFNGERRVVRIKIRCGRGLPAPLLLGVHPVGRRGGAGQRLGVIEAGIDVDVAGLSVHHSVAGWGSSIRRRLILC